MSNESSLPHSSVSTRVVSNQPAHQPVPPMPRPVRAHTAPQSSQPVPQPIPVSQPRIQPNRSDLDLDSIGSLTKDVEQTLQETTPAVKVEDKTRSALGKIFVRWFFLLLILILVGWTLYNIFIYGQVGNTELFVDMKTLIPVVWSVIGTPLWFVMGYYFKDDK